MILLVFVCFIMIKILIFDMITTDNKVWFYNSLFLLGKCNANEALIPIWVLGATKYLHSVTSH